MDIIGELMKLFDGNDVAHGKQWLTGETTPKGKLDSNGATMKSPITRPLWQRHLDGTYMMGILPIKPGNRTVKVCIIDVDLYKEQLSPIEVINKFRSKGLKMIAHRSKSGGLHLIMFLTDWVDAKLAIEKLSMIAAFLSFGTHEIFPKQVVVKEGDYGSFLSLPYFKGNQHLRTAFDYEAKAITNMEDYINFVHANMYTPEEFGAIDVRAEQVYPEGPPCLNGILAEDSHEGIRNDTLFNIAIMLRKQFPEDWEAELEKANQLLRPPLDARELQNVIKSHQKKEYPWFSCNKAPFNSFCDRCTCKTRKFGIGGDAVHIGNKSLAKILTEPPIFRLDIEVDEIVTRIELTTEELFNNRLFRMKCLEAVDKMPRATKEQDWTDEVNAMTNTMTKHAVPFETTTRGQLHDLLDGFLQDCSTDEEKNSDLSHCLSGGWVHIDAKNYYFRMKDFMSYLKTQSTVIFKNNYVAGILRMDFNAESERTDSVRYLSITKEKITNRPTSLKPQEIEDNDPF